MQFNVFQPSSSIYVDNQSCMKIAKKLDLSHVCTKHIEVFYHYITKKIFQERLN
jgi:hypothetical protein